MQDQVNLIDKARVPKHIAIIMDGNGRWAKIHGKERLFGHQNGVEAVREAVKGAIKIGVEYLTLYAFSTENWDRPKAEIDGLMTLLVSAIKNEVPSLNDQGIKLNAIGNLNDLPLEAQEQLNSAIDETKGNEVLQLNLALSYSSKWEITQAIKSIVCRVESGDLSLNDIHENSISQYMCTHGIPDPELMIRTSGEIRISNFMLWQLAYAELYFTDKLWPDFKSEDLIEAVRSFQSRERRFGKTSEQLG